MSNQENQDQNGSDNEGPPASPLSISSGELLPIHMEGVEEASRPCIFQIFDPNAASPIHSSIYGNDLIKLIDLVTQGKSLRVVDNRGDTPLHYAIRYSTPATTEVLEYLLSLEDLDLNTENHEGVTPLLTCTLLDKEREALRLIEAGADVGIASNEYITPLHYAAKFSAKLTETLILKGAEINCIDFHGDTPLHDAVSANSLETLAVLLYYNADANIANSEGVTPFMQSLSSGNYELADALFEYVTDFNKADYKRRSTLRLAILCNYPRVIEMIERGAEVNYDGNMDCNLFRIGGPMDINTFQYVWQRYNYSLGLGNDWPHILVSVLYDRKTTIEYKLKALNIILSCEDKERMLHLTQESEKYPIILPLVNRLFKMKVSSEDALKYCVILLSYGLCVYDLDLDMVYERYGYCELFKLLLHMEILGEGVNKFNIFPYMVYQIGDFTFLKRILDNRFSQSTEHSLDNVDYENILEHSANFQLMRWFEMDGIDPTCHMLHSYIETFPRVPKLQELAIYKARQLLRVRFNLKTSSQFYTALKYLHIPELLKKLISFEIPLYVDYTPDMVVLKKWVQLKRETFINKLDETFYNQVPFSSALSTLATSRH